MSGMIRTIVAAADGSRGSDAAVDRAALLAAHLDADLILVHITEIQAGRFGVISEGTEATESIVQRAEELAKEAGAQVSQTLKRVESVHGVAWDLLEVAKDADADLLCLGTSGHGPWAGAVLGSTSQRVLHHSPCPVLVVPASKGNET
jgi:nucleotide-binding universal stress UspA family protein